VKREVFAKVVFDIALDVEKFDSTAVQRNLERESCRELKPGHVGPSRIDGNDEFRDATCRTRLMAQAENDFGDRRFEDVERAGTVVLSFIAHEDGLSIDGGGPTERVYEVGQGLARRENCLLDPRPAAEAIDEREPEARGASGVI
jgi:hypothetical protein